MPKRFAGTCEPLCAVSVVALVQWISAIPFPDRPQQRRLDDGGIRPAMVSDPAWHGYGAVTDPVVAAILPHFPGCFANTRLLSVVMPGHAIEPHCDQQPPHWICRVHVPLTANDQSRFIVGGVAHVLRPGMAYRVNTEAVHSVENDGDTPRIHFMMDINAG